MMKILVIHPKDVTTDILTEIYSGRDWSIINTNPSDKKLKEMIKAHDRIIMLGHGTQWGLIGFNRLVIDSRWVYLLREKQCVFIWCNADMFVTKYDLKGFYTGMIISEYQEAVDYSVRASLDEISQSNSLFAESVKRTINEPDILKGMKELYSNEKNPVIAFNMNNLYHR